MACAPGGDLGCDLVEMELSDSRFGRRREGGACSTLGGPHRTDRLIGCVDGG